MAGEGSASAEHRISLLARCGLLVDLQRKENSASLEGYIG